MVFRTFVFIGFALCATYAHAGAWLQPRAQGLFIQQATYYGSSGYFDAEGDVKSQGRFNKYELQPYLEYGLFDNLTVGATGYAQHVSQSGASNRGIADPELFARIGLWKRDGTVVSIQPLVKLSGSFDSSDTPRGGSQSTDGELSLLYGQAMPIVTSNDYIDLRAGYRMRNRGLNDQLRFDAAAGLKLSPRWEVTPALRGIVATAIEDATTFNENGDLDYSLVKAEVGGIYHLNERQWLQATVFKHVAGIQTGDGYGLSLGFAQRF
jgi:hypothetical protein